MAAMEGGEEARGLLVDADKERGQPNRIHVEEGGGSGSGKHLASLLGDALGVVLITGSLLLYGVLQERIMTIGFGPHAELFKYSIFLVLCNRLLTFVLAASWVAATEPSMRPVAPLSSYACVSLANVVSSACQYEALKYVSFAVQTLAKSAKALPVMVWGLVLGHRKHKPQEYVLALLITFGCTIFVMQGSVASRTVRDAADPVYLVVGAALMLAYLMVDGLTCTWQDCMFSTHKISICHQVMFTTAFSSALSFAGSVAANQLLPSIRFLMSHPDALWLTLALSASSAAMQLVISYTIKRYGAVTFATIMTTRQLVAIFVSSFVFWTPLVPGQWLGVSIVFGAAYFKLYLRSSSMDG